MKEIIVVSWQHYRKSLSLNIHSSLKFWKRLRETLHLLAAVAAVLAEVKVERQQEPQAEVVVDPNHQVSAVEGEELYYKMMMLMIIIVQYARAPNAEIEEFIRRNLTRFILRLL